MQPRLEKSDDVRRRHPDHAEEVVPDTAEDVVPNAPSRRPLARRPAARPAAAGGPGPRPPRGDRGPGARRRDCRLAAGAEALRRGPKPPSDYVGEGKEDIVIQVHEGDSGSVIAQDLVDKGVIADVGMFISAASANPKLAAIQPGYYKLRTEIPAATAVAKLVDPENRVGKLVIPEGKQLDDITVVGSDGPTPASSR
jgi:UPF0755 protein